MYVQITADEIEHLRLEIEKGQAQALRERESAAGATSDGIIVAIKDSPATVPESIEDDNLKLFVCDARIGKALIEALILALVLTLRHGRKLITKLPREEFVAT